jgi:cytoskeletal protein CcmA (bactofilin family)
MVTRIEPSTFMKGNMESKEEIIIEGKFEGSISSTEKVTVAKGALVKGPVVCKEIDVGGIIEGDVTARECARLFAFGKIHGDLNTGHLFVEDGGVLAGKVSTEERSRIIPEPKDKK